ncbi:hypothetical protein CAMGR0001_1477 [Campylobacter gracilis RM3268]|uniref:Uncharacterized protein n=1 Tax=Campylobacter gracilis RM3268 TaxID=553220 RepID=C8PJS7_9BACT|nr:hypothetical protein CAMGR0001_1477 [Campylobacter gracilis RM3268]
MGQIPCCKAKTYAPRRIKSGPQSKFHAAAWFTEILRAKPAS